MADHRPTVVLTCGPSGSGKTTYARALERQGYVRLSLDVEVRRRFGRYGVDIPVERYAEYNAAVEPELRRRLVELVRAGRDVVVDLAFWRRADREEYKALVEAAGGRWRLVYFTIDPELLHRRTAARRARGDADAFPVTPELLDQFIATFEVPEGEGEEVIDPAAPPPPPAAPAGRSAG
ncbi:ATP-binding protein [Georgenia sp. TF02-10]|uniref:AAA family ATPase n=1 Tax=Georgenia sp. TF02-10 TaxID=2917725 RepID=UPI001FA7C8C5|nr:ATP-binding protein [Georgenia sp. TF02-10]UNX55030.1 ATP-binding protein [Georgenia sp. TF02-10]